MGIMGPSRKTIDHRNNSRRSLQDGRCGNRLLGILALLVVGLLYLMMFANSGNDYGEDATKHLKTLDDLTKARAIRARAAVNTIKESPSSDEKESDQASHQQQILFHEKHELGNLKPAAVAGVLANNSNSTAKQKNRKQKIVFVHLGKTAGSSITCMLDLSVQHSGVGDSQCHGLQSTTHPTAISQHVVQRIHLAPAPPVEQYTSFLITVRNPIERIISWFYYLHPNFPPVKKPHHKRHCTNFALFECWKSMGALAEFGLETPRITSNHTNHRNQSQEECAAWAWDAVTGTRYCWHNYWNYNRTYGHLLEEIAARARTSRGGMEGDDHIVVYVIRSEHAVNDWNVIDRLLGGTGEDGEAMLHNNEFGDTSTSVKEEGRSEMKMDTRSNRTLTEKGRLNLCNALCDDIQVYKRLLLAAENLDEGIRKESIDELLLSCPNELSEVRSC
jgi:hypothetical protein